MKICCFCWYQILIRDYSDYSHKIKYWKSVVFCWWQILIRNYSEIIITKTKPGCSWYLLKHNNSKSHQISLSRYCLFRRANNAKMRKYKTHSESTIIQNIADWWIKEINCLFCKNNKHYKNTKIHKYKKISSKYKILQMSGHKREVQSISRKYKNINTKYKILQTMRQKRSKVYSVLWGTSLESFPLWYCYSFCSTTL